MLTCVPGLAGGAQTHAPGWFGAHPHWARGGAWHAPRPSVVRGYYPDSYGPVRHAFRPHGYPPAAALDYAPPIVAYRSATAYVPVTTYAPVPVRIYYVPQQQPYYNVPPYAVREPCMCN
jgi:hypothetical protein